MAASLARDFALGTIKACVFDAYGTLFDVNCAAARQRDRLGERWQPLADLWRSKQLQYTWLLSLSGRYAGFEKVTRQALDFALASMNLADPDLADRLVASYRELDAYPEVAGMLSRLHAAGLRLAILSNGTPEMLAAAADRAGLTAMFDSLLSADAVGIYKPHPRVYRLACERLNVVPEAICFVSSNGWDAFCAKAFGYRVVWCNRHGQQPERVGEAPDAEIRTLDSLAGVLGLA